MSITSRVRSRLRRTWPDRVVRRDVQGVVLELPWSHRLPDYARAFPRYGQNLVEVARIVAEVRGEPLGVVDVGANVGDSALQILAAVDGRVACVEGDAYWLRYLHRNVDSESRITVVPALVVPDERTADETVAPVRHGGTTHFVAGDGHDVAVGMTADEVRAAAGDLGSVSLVKSDTDGYDARIIPAIARAWKDDRPVLFFEFDPALTREVGDDAPDRVWSELEALGYERVLVWDNFGNPIGSLPISGATVAAAVLGQPFEERGYHYWDVAVVHRDDDALARALEELVGGRHGAEGAQHGAE